ncbi:Non-specific serine/threonine protein kinase protein [Dioscorea alata]|uniref:Non-specific serine/threonine protein kinase protein n=1 Tax=Dioscorea alata TaxID=55571 RepID=A0ACB7WDK2_DIOAL|nr:Non-specific serine/threonine protein kinase protein [Dioscorea alata]
MAELVQVSLRIHLFFFFFFFLNLSIKTLCHSQVFIRSTLIYPLGCTPQASCNSYLYHVSHGLSMQTLASLYSANISLIKPIKKKGNTDYLISVPCTCETIDNGTVGFFHDTLYMVKAGDFADNITSFLFSGQAYNVSKKLFAGVPIIVHLPCGCYSSSASYQSLVTYTVQQGDTLSAIAELLFSDVNSIRMMNPRLTADPEYLNPGWVLFVPMGLQQSNNQEQGEKNKTGIGLEISIPIAILLVGGLIFLIYWRHKSKKPDKDPTQLKDKSISKIAVLENKFMHKESNKELLPYESERPLIFSLEEIEEATANFDETRKIGSGGYGSVYFGMLGKQEVAVKKMKSSKSKEFFAELKVLCKVHHINVVELIGYASGDDHLYLVYEYVKNGSLSEHLHDPLLNGHQPLSWNARAQIALDAARGIEYIHDHTKSRYVHRDIKTSNILLDDGLRAKIADFGLAKLVERTEDEDCYATRLVGTPGYLPPESVCELQMNTKTDVFAFGVVLAELLTGYRALIRDSKEANKMRSLISIMKSIFQNEDPEAALEAIIDVNLKQRYPIEDVYKMTEISIWCLQDDATFRPEMREIIVKLSQILMSSIEWEASLGGNSEVFSGLFSGR